MPYIVKINENQEIALFILTCKLLYKQIAHRDMCVTLCLKFIFATRVFTPIPQVTAKFLQK